MENVVYTDTVAKKYNTYKIEITSWEDDRCGTLFQTFINGQTLMNQSENLEEAKKYISGAIWSREDLASLQARTN